MLKSSFFFLAIVVFCACSSTKKTTENKVAENKNTQNTLFRFSVSFISIGAGTDNNAQQQFLQFIQLFNKKHKVEIKKEIVNWGREGEIDYCLKLNELSKKQQEQFIAETKETLKNSTLVRYKENSICKDKN